MDAFADTLHLSVRPSRIGQGVVIVGHAVAGLICLVLMSARPLFVLLLLALGISAVVAWRRAILRSGGSVVRLRWQIDGRWRWQSADGQWCAGDCPVGFAWGSALVVLSLRADGRRLGHTHVLLFADALDGASHRRLRARLRIAPHRRRVDE